MIKNNISESPFFDINNCCDLYKKLEFDFKTLSRDDMKPYYLMNYLFTSNHLYDWIKNDNNISDDIKADMKHKFNLKTKNGSGEINQEFDIIKSLCNRSKHFEKEDYDYPKEKIDGGSFDNWDFSNFSFAGCIYNVIISDGSKNVFDICEKNYQDWTAFFSEHKDKFASIDYFKEDKYYGYDVKD